MLQMKGGSLTMMILQTTLSNSLFKNFIEKATSRAPRVQCQVISKLLKKFSLVKLFNGIILQ
jgi:hypothetical protein